MGTGSATLSILQTEASDKNIYDLYVTRTKALNIEGQDSSDNFPLEPVGTQWCLYNLQR